MTPDVLGQPVFQKCFTFVWIQWPVLVYAWLFYIAVIIAYRLTFHPLASFPGPKLAGASYCYEAWFDIVQCGRFTREIARLHAQYGPIIRITPEELHCNDAGFIDTIYSRGRHRRHKSLHFLAAIPWFIRQSSAGTADYHQHMVRRSAVSKYFSRAQITQHQGLVHQKVQRLCDKMLEHCGRGSFNLTAAYSCLTTDVITPYCFSSCTNDLEKSDWQPSFKGTIDAMTRVLYLTRQLPFLGWFAARIPLTVVKGLSNDLSAVLKFVRVEIPQFVAQSKAAMDSNHGGDSRRTIIQSILESKIPSAEKTPARLTSEATALVMGGTHTTATVLTIITYHLLANPTKFQRLQTELQAVVSDPRELPSWSLLEQLPYLSAIILEGLRLMHGIASRYPLISPDEDLLFKASWQPPFASEDVEVCHKIPRGFAIGMSAYLVHSDPKLFPDPGLFLPERWLDTDNQRNRSLEHFLMSFSKGRRQCLGMHLAHCELYVAIAAMALRVFPHMELYQTTVEDVAYDHDQLISMPKHGSKGVRVSIH